MQEEAGGASAQPGAQGQGQAEEEQQEEQQEAPQTTAEEVGQGGAGERQQTQDLTS